MTQNQQARMGFTGLQLLVRMLFFAALFIVSTITNILLGWTGLKCVIPFVTLLFLCFVVLAVVGLLNRRAEQKEKCLLSGGRTRGEVKEALRQRRETSQK